MTIKVLVFGQLTDIIQKNEISLDNCVDTENLTKTLIQQFPKLAEANYRIAINKKLGETNTKLNEGDVVALLPPFSGG